MKKALAVCAIWALSACGGGSSTSVAPLVQLPSTSPVLQGNSPPKFTIVDLGVNVVPAAINASNLIVGSIVTSGPSVGFSYHNGTTQLFVPLAGDTGTAAYDVNDAGTIVGASLGPSSTSHAVTFSGATPHDLGNIQGNDINAATAINNAGEIVGWSESSGNMPIGAPWCSAGVVYLPGPPQLASGWGGDPRAINDNGMIVGATCADPPDRESPFEYPSGGVALPSSQCCGPPISGNQANDVNNKSDVVVQANDYNGYPHGWLVLNRTTVVEIPGLTNDNNDINAYSFANALNGSDVVVGSATNTNGGLRIEDAMMFMNGKPYDLNSFVTGPGCSRWVLQNATDINNSGYIVGTGTLNGVQHGFLLVPKSP